MIIKSILAASAALIITASAASAAEVAALTGDNTIAIVDTSQKKVVKTWNITGIAGKVLGIDVRPADGMLYARRRRRRLSTRSTPRPAKPP